MEEKNIQHFTESMTVNNPIGEEAKVVNCTSVNVRAWPSPDAAIKTTLKAGEFVSVVRQVEGQDKKTWVQISSPTGADMYVMADYLETVE